MSVAAEAESRTTVGIGQRPFPHREYRSGLPRRSSLAILVLFLSIFLACATRTVSTTVAWGIKAFVSASETTGTEAAQPLIATKVARGEMLYRDWRAYPHDLLLYGPATYWVPGTLARFAGWNGGQIWLAGRAISLAAGIGILVASIVLWRQYQVRWWIAAAGVVALVPMLLICNIAVTFRPDLPSIALSLGGIAASLKGRRLLAPVPFFIAAVAFKQTALVAPMALFIHLVTDKRRRDALVFAFSFALPLVVGVGLLTVATDGRFVEHATLVAVTPKSLEVAASAFWLFLQVAPLALIPGIYQSIRALSRRGSGPLPLYASLSILLGIVAASRVGGGINYFLEGTYALTVLGFLSGDEVFGSLKGATIPSRRIIVALLIGACLLPIDRSAGNRGPISSSTIPGMRDFLDTMSSNIGTRRVFPGDLAIAAIGEYPHPYTDGFFVDWMTKAGRLPPDSLVHGIQGERFEYALMPEIRVSYGGFDLIPGIASSTIDSLTIPSTRIRVVPPGDEWGFFLTKLKTEHLR